MYKKVDSGYNFLGNNDLCITFVKKLDYRRKAAIEKIISKKMCITLRGFEKISSDLWINIVYKFELVSKVYTKKRNFLINASSDH